ncbi:hypothetical protein PO185_01340 [Limosilactobacillus mucosae]|uniref:Uncharacterized protein n=1 Tax=Limosilactobacillus mucosae TaxID=97478 RepID=A0A7L9VQ02_LIMMU|nr:hypothetical protein [Limosilactobacillus mucosae]MDC2838793.1 hypothetical protein [Limosilactobacillus mucosae]MDC2842295.1 hypothetical protein [Limosilactobacillus mucosae]MDC2844341.1 hypothetical protein [Limosilactobacillus mucosae]MDE8678194.1 hypothetical protein [Limosilactobacillus mucosae]MDM8220803.1 hypothetical protein [Limosilactobacillus mucosae]
MERNFKNSKLSFKMVSEGNEDGIWRSYTDAIEKPTDDQINGCIKVLTDLSNETYFYGRVVNTIDLIKM